MPIATLLVVEIERYEREVSRQSERD
jgi:hypothetical protein